MSFIVEYFKLIDLLALAALAALACAALVRNGSVWLFVAGILVAIWGAVRVLGIALKRVPAAAPCRGLRGHVGCARLTKPRHARPSSSMAAATTRSGSNPNLRCSSLSGADAPKVFMPMTRPSGPT